MTTPSRSSLTTAQRRIQQAALQLFAEKGSAQVTMSELAKAAGVARGTVHNNLESPEQFFRQVAAELATEMYDRITASSAGIRDPAQRLGFGIRFYVRRAHDEPHWGRFILRFALNEEALHTLWLGQPMQDLLDGLKARAYDFRQEQMPSAIGLVASIALGAIFLVVEGHRTWREAGSDAAEFALRAFGLRPEQARKVATMELPPLLEVQRKRTAKRR